MEKVISYFTSKGDVDIPSSKSVAHRALISAFIQNKKCEIKDVDVSDDISATIGVLNSLGGEFKLDGRNIVFYGRSNERFDVVNLDVCESGSTLRFLIPVAMFFSKKVIVHGSKRLLERPLNIYENIFKRQGITFKKVDDTTIMIEGNLCDEDFEVEGNVSSQFITGLIFFKVLNESKSKIIIIPPLFSKNYIDITLDVLSSFGYKVLFENNVIKYCGTSKSENVYVVEKDYSQLAFFAVKAAINGELVFKGFNPNSYQGDKAILTILKMVGADISFEKDVVRVRHNKLKAFDIDLENCIDLGPIVFVLASFCDGTSVIRNVERLKIKESDRLEDMKKELNKIGVNFVIDNNNVYIEGKKDYFGNFFFEGHNDHRIVMALSVLSSCIHGECKLFGTEAVRKSYCGFFEDFMKTRGF